MRALVIVVMAMLIPTGASAITGRFVGIPDEPETARQRRRVHGLLSVPILQLQKPYDTWEAKTVVASGLGLGISLTPAELSENWAFGPHAFLHSNAFDLDRDVHVGLSVGVGFAYHWFHFGAGLGYDLYRQDLRDGIRVRTGLLPNVNARLGSLSYVFHVGVALGRE